MTVNNQIHAVPYVAYLYFLIYNKKLFSEAGARTVPSSWDGLLQTLSTIRGGSGDFGLITETNTDLTWLMEVLWYNSGVGYFGPGSANFTSFNVKNKMTIATPAAVEALEYYKSLCATAPGGIDGCISVTTTITNADFAKGTMGAVFDPTVELVVIQQDNPRLKGRVDYDVPPFPKGPVRQGVHYSTQALGVPKLSENPDEAWQFIEFLSSQEGVIAPPWPAPRCAKT